MSVYFHCRDVVWNDESNRKEETTKKDDKTTTDDKIRCNKESA